jgi:hypothetical protein
LKALPLLIVAGVTWAGFALAQAPADGVFVSAPNEGLVWKSAAAYDQWQRAGGQGHAIRDSLIACRVEPGTPFVVQYAIPPQGYGIEVAEGPNKGCRGVAMSGTVELHEPMTRGTKVAPRDRPPGGIGTRAPTSHPQAPGMPVRPLVPPLPAGGAVPVPPLLR